MCILAPTRVVLQFLVSPTFSAHFDNPFRWVHARTVRTVKFVAPMSISISRLLGNWERLEHQQQLTRTGMQRLAPKITAHHLVISLAKLFHQIFARTQGEGKN